MTRRSLVWGRVALSRRKRSGLQWGMWREWRRVV